MAKKSKKKRKAQKKYQFVNTANKVEKQPANEPAKQQLAEKPVPKNVKNTTKPSSSQSDNEIDERVIVMKRETRLTGIIGGAIIAGLLIIWVLFEHTGLGNHIYNLIRL